MAHGDNAKTTALFFRIGRSTLYKLVEEVTSAIIKHLQPIYLPKVNDINWENVAEGYQNRWQFPNCLGGIDGKHCRIRAPPNSGSAFHNYKSFFSMVLLAGCDAYYRFTWVHLGDYGMDTYYLQIHTQILC